MNNDLKNIGRSGGRWNMASVGVLALTLALLLSVCGPALLSGRESSRRTSCDGNLAAIGASLHAYAELKGTFPPVATGHSCGAWIPSEVGDDKSDPTTINWVMLLLPYLDEQRRRTEIEVARSDPSRASGYAAPFSRFQCASDTYNSSENLYLSQFSRGNYGINAGSNDICLWPGDRDQPCPNGASIRTDPASGIRTWFGDGVAGYNRAFRLDELSGGARHLVAVEELRAGLDLEDSRGVWALGMAGASVTHQHGLYGDDGGPNNSSGNADDILGCSQTTKTLGRDRLIRENMPCAAHIGRARQATARSMHPGGVNCLMADESSKFVANDIDLNVWHVMHSREYSQRYDFTSGKGNR
jgi:hypothetical protein